MAINSQVHTGEWGSLFTPSCRKKNAQSLGFHSYKQRSVQYEVPR